MEDDALDELADEPDEVEAEIGVDPVAVAAKEEDEALIAELGLTAEDVLPAADRSFEELVVDPHEGSAAKMTIRARVRT